MTTEPAPVEAFEAQGRTAIKTWVFFDTLQCAIYWGYGGFNGYVRLPEGSIDRTIAEVVDDVREDTPTRPGALGLPVSSVPMGYDMLQDLQVHGGVTFGPDDGWIGFDTAHAGDNWTDEEIEKYLREGDPASWEELERRRSVMEKAGFGRDMAIPGRFGREHGSLSMWDRDWTMEQLVEETNALAAQVYERLRGLGVLAGV
jgi:hypothetical protein